MFGDAQAVTAGATAGTTAAASFTLADAVLVTALATLAGARAGADVAGCCLPLLTTYGSARGAAVGRRDGRRVVLLASAGYPCDTMAPGSCLPLDAGLPITEAVRTGRVVVQGTGPGWVAVPFGRERQRPGALLLSLRSAPPAAADLARLHRLAAALGDALARADLEEESTAQLAVVHTALARQEASDPACEVAVRSRPAIGSVGGDWVACLPDGRGNSWLLAADVVGVGLAAALVARIVSAAARTAAGWADGPSALLEAVEDIVAPEVGPDSFVTAVAVHLANGVLTAASAGHPPPLLLLPDEAQPVPVRSGPPLAMVGSWCRERVQARVPVPRGAAVLVHTDGLTERRGVDGMRLLDAADLAHDLPSDLDAVADRLLAAADEVGPAEDDVSLLVARRRR